MRVTAASARGGSAGVPMIGGADGSGDWGVCDPAEPRNRRTRASIVVESGQGAAAAGRYRRLTCATQLLACRIPRRATRFCTRMRMPTTSPGWMMCASSTASPAGRWMLSRPSRRWTS